MNLLALAGISVALTRASAGHVATDTTRCQEAAAFLRGPAGAVAIVEPDTVDDWRTRRRTSGCRVTAAGVTRIGVASEGVRFYERLRAAGWTRTPDPRDSPNEASLRFRKRDADCLFNVAGEALLFTDAESRVVDAVSPKNGEERYHVFVMCVPAAPAAG
jgi:hypothetical protein